MSLVEWQQLRFSISGQQSDSAEALLQAAGAFAVSFQAAQEEEEIFEPDLNDTPLWEEVQVTALFAEHAVLTPVIDQLQQAFDCSHCSIEKIPEQSWQRNYQQQVKPVCIAERLWIYPSWEPILAPDKPHIILDPGLAFGTGTHPTTGLCLEWLIEHVYAGVSLSSRAPSSRAPSSRAKRGISCNWHGDPLSQAPQDDEGMRVIDYGCGSGILALAAVALGAQEVWAVDNDPQALEATRENARRNQCEHKIHPVLPEALPELMVDLLVANILSKPLITLAPHFAAKVKPGGHLALSGVLKTQIHEVIPAYQDWFSLYPPKIADIEAWVRLDGVRNLSYNRL